MLTKLLFGALPLCLTLTLPVASQAQCATAGTGARCVTAPVTATPASLPAPGVDEAAKPLVEPGQIIERGKYSMLLNAGYYGLPPVQDGWVYMRIGRDVWRVDWRSHEVIDRVTEKTASNF